MIENGHTISIKAVKNMEDDIPRPRPRPSLDFLELSSNIIEISVAEPLWRSVESIDFNQLVDKALSASLNEVHFASTKLFELSVLLTGDEEIQQLNKQYRNMDKSTNVLAFESGVNIKAQLESDAEYPISLGDIVLSYQTIKKEAEEQCKKIDDHITHLLVHGVLHLLGFDHQDDFEAEEMESLEAKILAETFQITNPYT